VFVRRHHCRICGRIFCSSCTFNSIQASRDAAVPASGEQSWLRVCNYCEQPPHSLTISGAPRTPGQHACCSSLLCKDTNYKFVLLSS
jgi:hypothetical protein